MTRVLLLSLGVVLTGTCPCPVWGQQTPTATAPATRESAADREVIAKIRSFASSVRRHPVEDERFLAELGALSKSIGDDRLSAVERFAATDEAKPIAWPLVRLLVDRKRFEAAASVVVTTLAAVPAEDRPYAMWKWWAYNFGEQRPDSAALNGMVDGLLSEFARGPEDRRLIVCDLFGMRKEDAKLPVGQFREKLRPSTRKS